MTLVMILKVTIMNNELIEQLPFSEKDVDIENITASLLALSALHNILTDTFLSNLRCQFDKIFIENATQFTKSESSTIPIQRAEILYESILYHSDVYLLSLGSILEALKALSSMEISKIVENGKTLILQYYNDAQVCFKKAFKNRLDIPVIEYQNVHFKAFDEFFSGYNGRFNAQNEIATIDYPLLYKNQIKAKGVLYIKAYYACLMLENEFCKLFSSEDILWLIESYGTIYGCDCREILFNVSEIVLVNMLVGGILEKAIYTLRLTTDDIRQLKNKLSPLSSEDITNLAMAVLTKCLNKQKNPTLINYLMGYIPRFSTDLYQHLINDNLNTYICYNDQI